MGGYRSPLAFWVGGAAASPPPAAGAAKRSLVAPWLGGAAAPGGGPAPGGGIRSPLAPWLGGAAAVPLPVGTSAGVRSLLAPWLGGAAATPAVVPPEPPGPPVGSGRHPFRYPIPPLLADQLRRRVISDDELLMLIATRLIASGRLH